VVQGVNNLCHKLGICRFNILHFSCICILFKKVQQLLVLLVHGKCIALNLPFPLLTISLTVTFVGWNM